ncbi:uncharacterized protein K489DRAFT_122967 [Dissoconium aciculare CBS 342.82]|uniref:Uncharacterized protein n=1 Tax=Dissoconium aciculare CBS 342.82 TaxID=1314786 RepID=A0A6J3MGA0_9PEZI|nr:uncharacterized protein K489DRAFT_122967 [Dissoconium aciculare CBS 342.82]KAF1826699.1 hypothetical protein K489DRAFT_122967 [Dissoconium aciculare CBS 342.82]
MIGRLALTRFSCHLRGAAGDHTTTPAVRIDLQTTVPQTSRHRWFHRLDNKTKTVGCACAVLRWTVPTLHLARRTLHKAVGGIRRRTEFRSTGGRTGGTAHAGTFSLSNSFVRPRGEEEEEGKNGAQAPARLVTVRKARKPGKVGAGVERDPT